MTIARVIVCFVALISSLPQQERRGVASSEGIVEQFVKMDVKGSRLTAEGWRTADDLFVKHTEPPRVKVLVVIARDYAVSKSPEKGNENIYFFGYEQLGNIDTSSLRFTPTNSGYIKNQLDSYTVVPTNAHFRPGDETAPKQQPNPIGEFRIDGAQPKAVHITAETAIRYLKEMRAKVTDSLTRKNADIAIAKLSAYK